jgi:hypothetical protein
MKKLKFKMFKDILMEKGYYSQGRIYLFLSIISYYTALGILTLTGLNHKTANIDINNFKIIIDGLQYAMVLFAGYVFGGKFVDVIKETRHLKGKNDPIESLNE